MIARALSFAKQVKRVRAKGAQGAPLRIAYGRIFHEACADSPLLTTQEDFLRMHALEGAELAEATTLSGSELKGYLPHAELTGFVQAARVMGNVEAVPLASYMAVPNGPVTEECFDWLLNGLLTRLEAAGELDGVYLALHGSMEVVGLREAPEAVILRRVRELVGPEVQIAVSYDLHANLSAGLLEPADVLIAYRSNPHWDLAPTGFRAGSRLIRSLRGEITPVHAWRKLPMVLGGGTTIDFLAPMRGVFRFMKQLERRPGVVSASLFMVHPFTSANNLGWAVHVSTDDDADLAERLADELAERVWSEKDVALPPMRSIDASLDEVASGRARKLGPVTLVDVDDIVGAGAPGGNTRFVQALAKHDRGLTALVPVHDPELVAELWRVPLNTTTRVTLRGTPGYAQPEVTLDVTVVARHDGEFGRRLRLDSGRLHLSVGDRSPLPIHPKFWRQLGLNPRQADLIVQKNFFHYRMFYLTLSFTHIPVQSAGASDFRRLSQRSYAVPVHPVAKVTDWRTHELALRQAERMSPKADMPSAAMPL
ncbi:MAG TPA: M81 family metallopeptidase [Polyangiaceae bacterium]|nr:M81 family metallopeptidase [Polyangiaceae bacterium]